MAYRDQDDDDEVSDVDDRDLPAEADMDEDEDEPAVVPCPYCGAEISEDAEVCPKCGNFISAEDAPRPRRPWWVVAGVVVCLVIVVLAWVLS